jgi:hypothetical protein
MYETFHALYKHCHWWPFVRTIGGPVDDINELYNKVDIVVSCLSPLYARSIECFGANKPLVCPGYREHEDYPYPCDLEPESMARAIIEAWENREWPAREWAEEHHDAEATAKEALEIYAKYL